MEARRPQATFRIYVQGIFPGGDRPEEDDPTFADRGYAGGPAPIDDITIRAGAPGRDPGSLTIHVDPWIPAVIGPDAYVPAPTTSPDP